VSRCCQAHRMSMRPEHLYLTDILDAARAIAAFCKYVRFEQFDGMICCEALFCKN
jgi:uncharacterized protein with HEPN domain